MFSFFSVFHCPALLNPPNGHISCTARNEVGSKCTTLCAEGYEAAGGDEYRFCSANQSWTGSPSICKGNLPCSVLKGRPFDIIEVVTCS